MLSHLSRRAAITLLSTGTAAAGVGAAIALLAGDTTGAAPHGAQLARLRRSPQFRDGRFRNAPAPREPRVWWEFSRWLRGAEHTTPAGLVPTRQPPAGFFDAPVTDLRATWLGHSSVLLEIERHRLLIDPVFNHRASPIPAVGPVRFFAPPVPLHRLPALDAVLISHDHYDHLDVDAVKYLAQRGVRFVVPLGVGAHLRHWGVPEAQLTELDWWERTQVGTLSLVATPARHFSGRSLRVADRDLTLWSGWAVLGARHRVAYTGDTGMFPGLAEVGARLGPFDLTLVETGGYDAAWADVHLGPEQAVRAHQLLRGKVMLPVHWGTYEMALHPWSEPIERVWAAAERAGITLVTPRPGEPIDPDAPPPHERWWANAAAQPSAHALRAGVAPLSSS